MNAPSPPTSEESDVPTELRDRPERWQLAASETVLDTGRVVRIRRDTIADNGLGSFVRDVVVHPGAVGIIALDDRERVLLVRQYRHPVAHRLYEPPAGLLDIEGEPPLVGAQRELYEEGHVRASDWRLLVDAFSSPGMTTEGFRIYLARGITEVPESDRHNGEHEEADMPVSWHPLADVVSGVLSGALHNPILAMGALAAWTARNGAGYESLRPADEPWPARSLDYWE